MNFGFVKAALKAVGKGALTIGETVGPAAATAFGGPVAGTLAKIAVDGIMAAQAKHAAIPQGTLVQTPHTAEPVPITLAKKLDAMQYIESQAGVIADVILNATGHPVADPDRFAQGVDLVVEGLVDVLKAMRQLPVAAPQPVVQAVPKSIVEPAPQPAADAPVVPAAFVGVVSNADAPSAPAPRTTVDADVIALLNQVLQKIGPTPKVA